MAARRRSLKQLIGAAETQRRFRAEIVNRA
jgi:hypothetical protein